MLYPINPLAALSVGSADVGPFLGAAGSFHPGGANFGLADGSVRFLSNTIDSWPIDATSGMPFGVSGSTDTPYTPEPGTKIGVYQALSTRNRGEAIGISGG